MQMMRVSWLRKAVGYRGAALPFHSSCQGLAGLAGTRSQPGPAAPCTCPARDALPGPSPSPSPTRGCSGASSRRIGGESWGRRGARAARAEGTGKGLRLQSSCQAPADPALAAAPRPLPLSRFLWGFPASGTHTQLCLGGANFNQNHGFHLEPRER